MTDEQALIEVLDQLRIATEQYGPFHSAHEGFAVLKEEVDELWETVRLSPFKHSDRANRMGDEAIQVAAMALRFLRDCV